MTEREKTIHTGLNLIGKEVASFFEDAVEISHSDYNSKPYILAHLSREIEGGLRQIFASSDEKVKDCPSCGSEIKPFNHLESILRALGVKEGDPFAVKWHSTAKRFHKLAHRQGPWKEPRHKEIFDEYWGNFLDILEYLVGNYYSIGDRLDTIIKNDSPSKSVLGTLPNLLTLDAWRYYFYQNLKSEKWLKPLYDNGYFSLSNHASPVEVEPNSFSHPYWDVLNYLENIMGGKGEIDTDNISIIRLISKNWTKQFLKKPETQNFRTNYVIFKLLCWLPDNQLNDKDFRYIESTVRTNTFGIVTSHFEELIKKFLESKNKTLTLETVKILFAYKIIPNSLTSTDTAIPIFDTYYFKKFVKDYSGPIIDLCDKEAVELSLDLIRATLKDDEKLFNKLSVSAIYDEDNQISLDDKLDCQITFFTRDALLNQSTVYLDKLIPELLKEEHPIFKRLAIHTITERYLEFERLFWNHDLFKIDYHLKLEVFKLFRKSHSHFNGEQFETILDWLEKREYYVPDNYSEENKERSIAASKIEWLQSLENSDNRKVKEYLLKQKTINDVTYDHPGHDTWHSGITIGHQSPINIDDLTQLNLEEVLQYYEDFKSSYRGFMGPSVDGLLETIQVDIAKQAEKYITNKALLETADIHFLESICDALRNKLEEEIVPMQFAVLLEVIQKHLMKGDFWVIFNKENSQNRQFIYYYLWFINQILRIDKVEITDSNFDIIKETLLKIHKEDFTVPYVDNDLNFTALNHTKGIIYASFIEYSLRVKRMDNYAEWDTEIKSIFEEELNKDDIEPLFFNSLGRYLDNIPFLEKEWYETNFNKIFPLDNDEAWSSSFNSHFFYSSRVYQERFKLFNEGGHFKKSFSKPELLTSDAQNRICQHILIAYLDKEINLGFDEEPLASLLAIELEESYENIIRFFWNNNFSKPNIERLRLLWLHIYKLKEKIKDSELANYFISGCTKWIQHFKDLDDELFEAIKEGAINLAERDRYFFFEDLNKIIDDNLEKGGELLVAAFCKDATYDISRGLITDMVEKLYQNDFKEYADEICLLHIKHGQLYLREFYNKYNI